MVERERDKERASKREREREITLEQQHSQMISWQLESGADGGHLVQRTVDETGPCERERERELTSNLQSYFITVGPPLIMNSTNTKKPLFIPTTAHSTSILKFLNNEKKFLKSPSLGEWWGRAGHGVRLLGGDGRGGEWLLSDVGD